MSVSDIKKTLNIKTLKNNFTYLFKIYNIIQFNFFK